MTVHGGERFADAVDGLRATRPDDPAHLTAIVHSYGSTTVAREATDPGMKVDDLVLVGSPGAGEGVDRAEQLGVDADHVFVGRNSEDPVAHAGDEGSVNLGLLFGAGLGNDPTEDDFGASRFEAEDFGRDHLPWFSDHNNYFNANSESLYNIGWIVDGQAHEVNEAAPVSSAGPAVDPEVFRSPHREGEEGASRTDPRRRR